MPYRTQGKITHRPWFAPEEYKALDTATRQHAQRQERARDRWNAEQLHDYVLFMANTGLRPDEAKGTNLQHRDVKMVKDQETGELILEIEVRGKRGVGYRKRQKLVVLRGEQRSGHIVLRSAYVAGNSRMSCRQNV